MSTALYASITRKQKEPSFQICIQILGMCIVHGMLGSIIRKQRETKLKLIYNYVCISYMQTKKDYAFIN